MWGWVVSVGSSLGLAVLMRWMFHAGKPRDDLGTLERVVIRAAAHVGEVVANVWRYYGPITEETKQRWADLALKYRGGGYGLEGT